MGIAERHGVNAFPILAVFADITLLQHGNDLLDELFRLQDAVATQKNTELLTWAIANDISQHQGSVVILTPDRSNAIICAVLASVQTRQWTRNNDGTYGPYPHIG